MMSVTSIQEPRPHRAGRWGAARVVAVVLEDGSVRPVADVESTDRTGDRWATGQLSGPHWLLWWERRTWAGPRDRSQRR